MTHSFDHESEAAGKSTSALFLITLNYIERLARTLRCYQMTSIRQEITGRWQLGQHNNTEVAANNT